MDGEASSYGEHDTAGARRCSSCSHVCTRPAAAVASTAATAGLHISGRHHLQAALQELDLPWAGGPFSEPAREALARNSLVVVELLALADRFAADVAGRGGEWVVTHGEPHAGNVMRTADGCVLVDGDTVALAPPERDLWMVAADGVDTYTRGTGHELDEVAVDFFALTWDLKDLAEYLHPLRSPHRRSKDTAFALEVVRNFASSSERWARFLDRGVGRLDT